MIGCFVSGQDWGLTRVSSTSFSFSCRDSFLQHSGCCFSFTLFFFFRERKFFASCIQLLWPRVRTQHTHTHRCMRRVLRRARTRKDTSIAFHHTSWPFADVCLCVVLMMFCLHFSRTTGSFDSGSACAVFSANHGRHGRTWQAQANKIPFGKQSSHQQLIHVTSRQVD